MPEVSHQRTFEKTMVSDKYVIAKTCCAELKDVTPTWNHCPFCGEEIKWVEQQDITLER